MSEFETLAEFENEIHAERKRLQAVKRIAGVPPETLLFRGQSDANWDLDTTLERVSSETYRVRRYNDLLGKTVNPVRSLTGRDWDFETDLDSSENFYSPPNYEYMIYARHHGFPTPLLDWTESVYVALFFAFRHVTLSERVAVFSYAQAPHGATMGWHGHPTIMRIGSNVRTHPRHFQQQSQYTVCTQLDENHQWRYCSHQNVFDNVDPNQRQDVLSKHTLPSSLRSQILVKLNEMNINAFSLFSSEEGLMESLANKFVR